VYIIGGSNSKREYSTKLLSYSLEKKELLEPIEFGKDYFIGNFHTSNLVGSVVYIFGGKEKGFSNQLYALDLEKKISEVVETSGDIPTPRYGHTSVEYDNKLYIFGGYNEAGINKDFYELHLDDFSWHKITSEDSPEPRTQHFSILVEYNNNPCILIYGGKKSKKEIFKDIHLYDIDNKNWIHLNTIGSNEPIARFSTKGFINKQKNLVIYGGTNKDILSDMWELNFKTLKWKNVTQIGSVFGARSGHELIYDNRQLYIIGGQTTFEKCSSTIEVTNRKKLVNNFFNGTDFKVLSFDISHFELLLQKYYDLNTLEIKSEDETFYNDYTCVLNEFDLLNEEKLFEINEFLDEEAPFTDCQVVLSDATVPSHRVLLFAEYKELQKHLEGDTLNLSPMTKSQFNVLKKFLYCNELDPSDINEANAIELLKIAHEYKINQLKSYCEVAIVEKSDFWDRYDLMEIAKKYEASYLESWVFLQFRINYEDIKNDTRFLLLEESMKNMIYQQSWPGPGYLNKMKKYQEKMEPTKCIMM